MTPPNERDVESEAPPEIGVECNSPPQSPSSRYQLFGAKNKIELETQQPLSKLIESVNHTWHDETRTMSTAEWTIKLPYATDIATQWMRKQTSTFQYLKRLN